MTGLNERLRALAAMPCPPQELRTLPGFLVARLLQVDDIQRLLIDALDSGADVTGTIPMTISRRTFAKRAVRRRLVRIATRRRRASTLGTSVHAIVCIPEWSRMGRSFFGVPGIHYNPVETETLALLALWTGEGMAPQPGSRIVTTAHHPSTDAVRNLLRWRELDDDWTVEQLEILAVLLGDGVEYDEAIDIARWPGW